MNNAEGQQPRRILVLVGTDMHPFIRICEWADRWASLHQEDHILVQHGYTNPPEIARGVGILTPDALAEAISDAQVVITHGGPGTIAAVRAAGIIPVIVPRDPELGEHVDSHQLRFAAWAGEHGLGTVIVNIQDLDCAVAAAFDGRLERPAGLSSQVQGTTRIIGALAQDLANGQKRRRSLPFVRRPRRIRPGPRS